MRLRRLAFSSLPLTLAVGACVPDTAVRDSPPRSSAAAAASGAPGDAAVAAVDGGDAAALIAAPRHAMPEGPAKWRTNPRADNGFYAVVDGLCSELAASRVGSDIVVHYGGAGSIYAMYRTGDASFMALRDDGLQSIGDPRIASPTGVAGSSLDDFWIADSTGTRSSAGAILHRYTKGVWKTYEKDQTNIHAWVDGGVIGSLGMAMSNGEVWVEGSSVKPPESMYVDLPYPRLSAYPSGDLLLVSAKNWTQNPDAPLVARHWKPGAKVTEVALEKLLPASDLGRFPELAEISAEEVYVYRGDRIVRWDGHAFQPVGKTAGKKSITNVHRAAVDDLWLETAVPDSDPPQTQLQHLTKEGATVVATPEPILDMDGVDRGAAWIVGVSGKLYRREGDAWKAMPLPSPIFSAQKTLKAKEVVVVSADDVIVKAKYWEKGPGWTEPELHTALFRTRPVKETLRCNEPDPENNNAAVGSGYQSWPPMATADCKTPFVVLARRTNARKVDDDWPRVRAGLKGHPELGELSLVEFVSGDRTFVGFPAKDLDSAKKALQLVAAKDRLRPEIVCGEPEPKRVFSLDPKTGAATAK